MYCVPTKTVRVELTEVMAILPVQYAEVIQRALAKIMQEEKFIREDNAVTAAGGRHG